MLLHYFVNALSASCTWNLKLLPCAKKHQSYILMNQWIATNTTDSYCLSKIVKRVESHIIFTLHTLKLTGLRSDDRVRWSERGWDKIWRLWLRQRHNVFGTMWWALAILLKDENLSSRCRTDVTECASRTSLSYQDLRSPMSTNWNYISRTSGQIWITLLLNVLLTNGASVCNCMLAFVLDTDI